MDELNAFERKIVEELGNMAGPEPPVDSAAVARAVAARAPKRSVRSRFSVVKLVIGGVVVAALIGVLLVSGVIQIDRGDGVPLAGSSPSPTTEVFSATTDWIFARSPFEENARFSVRSVAVSPSGEMVVAGSRNRRSSDQSFVWFSSDGQEWSRIALPGTEGIRTHAAESVTAWDGGFALVGQVNRGPRTAEGSAAVWISRDGMSWRKTAEVANASFDDLIAIPDGLAVLGKDVRPAPGFRIDNPQGRPTMWTSTDGVTWDANEVSQPLHTEGVADTTTLIGIARSDDGMWVAAGRYVEQDERGGPSFSKGIIWRSSNGSVWVPGEAPIAIEGVDVGPTALAWTPAGFTLAMDQAAESGSEGTLWRSPDGAAWERAAETGPGSVNVIAVEGTTQLAFAEQVRQKRNGPAFASTSSFVSLDGEGWMETTPLAGMGPVVGASFLPDGRVVLVGADYADGDLLADDAEPVVWIGEPN